jgi:hypothetical protein
MLAPLDLLCSSACTILGNRCNVANSSRRLCKSSVNDNMFGVSRVFDLQIIQVFEIIEKYKKGK